MADGLGDPDSVRRLGQALLSAGREVGAVSGDLSGQVRGLIPSGWAGDSAEAFSSDWDGKAGQAGQLAALCIHVGHALTTLADELDAASQQAGRAHQMTGGPASRFAVASTEQKSQQLQAQASGAAQQARAAVRAKLTGISVPKIGPPLTARQVTGWAERFAPPEKPSQPWYDSLFHGGLDVLKSAGDLVGMGPLYGDGSFGQTWADTAHQADDFSAGFGHALLGTLKGLGDLAGAGPLYDDPSFTQTWGGIADLAEPWRWGAFGQSWEGLGKGLLAWDDWKSDPSRADGEVTFNALTLGLGPLLKLSDAGEIAADTGRVAADVGGLSDAEHVQEIIRPSGNPIGVPGSKGVQVVSSQRDLDQIWDQIKAKLGRVPDEIIKAPKGSIDQYDLGDGQIIQYRPFSKSGGATIDIRINNEPITKIHAQS